MPAKTAPRLDDARYVAAGVVLDELEAAAVLLQELAANPRLRKLAAARRHLKAAKETFPDAVFTTNIDPARIEALIRGTEEMIRTTETLRGGSDAR